MNHAIIVSGTPGTGKTSIAKKIAKHYRYEYIHIGDEDEYIISEDDVKIIDIEKMNKWIEKKQEDKNLVIDSHLSHHYPPEKTKTCIITRCDPIELKHRLKQRKYSTRKTQINLEAEAMDLILQEALAQGHKVYELNTTHRTINSSANEAIKAINENKISYGKNDFTYYLTK